MIQRCFPQWHPSYSVGNWVLDNQHKKLLRLCSQAIDCQAEHADEGSSRFRFILDDLLDYADEHIRTEEGLLGKSGFPLLEQHKHEHAAYHDQLEGFLGLASRGKVDKEGLNQYLSDWWSQHILGSDKQYSAYIQRIRR